jgi:hypothetical protein
MDRRRSLKRLVSRSLSAFYFSKRKRENGENDCCYEERTIPPLVAQFIGTLIEVINNDSNEACDHAPVGQLSEPEGTLSTDIPARQTSPAWNVNLSFDEAVVAQNSVDQDRDTAPKPLFQRNVIRRVNPKVCRLRRSAGVHALVRLTSEAQPPGARSAWIATTTPSSGSLKHPVRPLWFRSCATHENNRSCTASAAAVHRQYNT